MRNLKDIPTTIGMPEGTFYPSDVVKKLFKEYGYYTKAPSQSFENNIPKYVFNVPNWLLNRYNKIEDIDTILPPLPNYYHQGAVENYNPVDGLVKTNGYLIDPQIKGF